MIRTIALIAGGFIAWSFLRSADAGASLLVDIVGFDKASKSVTVQFRNPSNKTLRVNLVFLDINLGSSKLAQINDSTGFDIPAGQTTKKNFRIDANLVSLALALPGLVADIMAKAVKDASVTGYIKAEDIRINVNKVLPLPLEYETIMAEHHHSGNLALDLGSFVTVQVLTLADVDTVVHIAMSVLIGIFTAVRFYRDFVHKKNANESKRK